MERGRYFRSMKCDVMVVGASAAGTMAAISAARSGANVILLDKSMRDGAHVANTLFQGMATRAGIELNSCYIKRELHGMCIISPSGGMATIPARGYFIDRKRFDEYYARLAEKEGVMLLQDEAIKLQLAQQRTAVQCRHSEIEAHVVIDASGVLPALAHQVNLSPMQHPQDIAWAEEATIRHPDLGEEDFFQYWIGSMAPGWKATFSPAGGDLATIGVFVRGYGTDVHSFFEKFLKIFKTYKSSIHKNIENISILSIKKGGDPIAVLPGELVSNGFMVTGGAAGQSGLAYSMRSGEICGEVAGQAVSRGDNSKDFLSRYQRLWWSEFGWEYRMARASLDSIRSMKDADIDRLVGGLSGRSLISSGSLAKKALYASIKVASVHPRALMALGKNLAMG